MKNRAPFINRRAELTHLHSWFSEDPNNILFIYGPKSSGKTTLIHHFIAQSQNTQPLEVRHFNLRERLLVQYEDFIKAFFGIDYHQEKTDIREKREYDIKIFRLSVEVLKGLQGKELDPLVVMKKELQKLVLCGKRPLIVIDELQALEGLYMNGQRELMRELFNFFVAITKESHLCHVLIASSDGYFIERIFHDSKLKKTSRFFLVDYLQREDILMWLNDLPKFSNINDFELDDSQINAIWEHFGGSAWEIISFLGELLLLTRNGHIPHHAFQQILEKQMIASWALFEDFAGFRNARQTLLIALARCMSKSGSKINLQHAKPLRMLIDAGTFSEESLENAISDLVRHNFLAYDPVTACYQLQGRSMELGLLRYAKE